MADTPHPDTPAAPAAAPRAALRVRFGSADRVPRVFQALVIGYVLITGELSRALQVALFGLAGGGHAEFTMALLLALLVDVARVAPVIVLARHPLGILHPLIIVVVLWPLLTGIPTDIEQLGGLGGRFRGEPLATPQFQGLGWQPPGDVWTAIALYNGLAFVSLLSIYAGFALAVVRPRPAVDKARELDPATLRRVLIGLIAVSLFALLALIQYRGGLERHLSELAFGRFRSLAGLGPLVALVDLGSMCLVVWTAHRPGDVRSPLFLVCLAAVAAGQFLSNGSRSSMVFLIMTVGFTWALRTRRIPWRVAVLAAPLLFLSLGALAVVRSSGVQEQTALQALESSDAAQFLERIQNEVEDRRFISAGVPVVAKGHEVTGLMFGETYVAAILGVIPRAVWEDKPRGPGSIYAQTFLGVPREGLSIPVPAFAEAFWNFHLPGVIVIFGIFGMLIRAGHELYLTYQENAFVLALFVMFATTFRMGTDDLVAFQQQMLMLLIVWITARYFAGPKRQPAERRTTRPPARSFQSEPDPRF